MTRYIIDGFEPEDDPTLAWIKWNAFPNPQITGTGNTFTYSTLHPHHGKYCAAATIASGNSGNNGKAFLQGPTCGNPCWMRAYVMADSLTDASNMVRILTFYDTVTGSTPGLCGIYNSAGTGYWCIKYYNGTTSVNLIGTVPVALMKMYCFCFGMYADKTTSTSWAKLYINGRLELSVSGFTTGTRGLNSPLVGIYFGDLKTGSSYTVWYDCVEINDTYIPPEQPMWSTRHNDGLSIKRGKSGRYKGLYLK